jgi:hypothetical protein
MKKLLTVSPDVDRKWHPDGKKEGGEDGQAGKGSRPVQC